MDDRTLLELAAKAVGIVGQYEGPDGAVEAGIFFNDWHDCLQWWNPLADDADAFELMVTLGLVVHVGSDAARALYDGEGCTEEYSGDKAASTRRAIVRAAAELGARK